MLRSHLYVSVSQMPEHDCFRAVDAMVEHARRNNERLDLTGALVFTESRFAQYIEGPADQVGQLVETIARDNRHRDITMLFDRISPTRLFGSWSLTYSEVSLYVDRHIKALIGRAPHPNRDRDAAQLMKLLLSTTGSVNDQGRLAPRTGSVAV